jgi:biopolymer transport protein ExbB
LFGDIGPNGPEAGKLASGIALILRATLWGLLIAIPSLITWSYFTKKVEIIAVEMETLCDQFLRRQYKEEEAQSPKSKVQSPSAKA